MLMPISLVDYVMQNAGSALPSKAKPMAKHTGASECTSAHN